MPQFDSSQVKALKDYLYYSNVHDAKIETFRYDRECRLLDIEAISSTHNFRINFTFEGVKLVLSVVGSDSGNKNTILSLTAEEDYSYLRNHTSAWGHNLDGALYLLFQMFSGDELHVVSDKMFVEITKFVSTGDGSAC